MEEFCIIYCTVPDEKTARIISDNLVGEKLAACVSTVPGIISVYTWEGKLCREGEFLLMIKTRSSLFDEICQIIKGLHPYDVPEIIRCPIGGGEMKYLQWIADSTAGG